MKFSPVTTVIDYSKWWHMCFIPYSGINPSLNVREVSGTISSV